MIKKINYGTLFIILLMIELILIMFSIHNQAKNFELYKIQSEQEVSELKQQLQEISSDLESLNNSEPNIILPEQEKNQEVSQQVVTVAYLDDRDLIERVVMAEAGNQEYLGIVAVAQTIKDRGDNWGMTYKEVVLAKNQYSSPYPGEVNENVKAAVDAVFNNGDRAFNEITTHFYSTKYGTKPSWADKKECRGDIGDHRFYG